MNKSFYIGFITKSALFPCEKAKAVDKRSINVFSVVVLDFVVVVVVVVIVYFILHTFRI